jgi:PAS domain S-box-containing protein
MHRLPAEPGGAAEWAMNPAARPLHEQGESDQLLRLLFDHAGEGICVFDADWRLQAWNARFLSMTGLPPVLAKVGMPVQLLMQSHVRLGHFGAIDGEAGSEAEVQRRLVFMREVPAAVTELPLADGRTLELRRNPTPGGGFIVMYADITARKHAQAALADEQRMLRLLIQNTEQGIWFIDNELRTTDANPAMCRMLGLPLEQVRGRDIFSFVDEANAEIFREHVRQRAQGKAESYEIALRHASGHAVHCWNNATPIFDAQGRKAGAVGMFSDISLLKHTEHELRLTHARLTQQSQVLHSTLQNLRQGVLGVGADGRVHTWNLRLLDLLQMPQSLLETRPTLEALAQWQMDRGQLGAEQLESLQRYQKGHLVHYRRTRPDGVVLDVETHRADDGGLVRTFADITDAVHAEQALRESEARFRAMADAAPALIWQSDTEGAPVWFNQRWLEYTGRSLAGELALHWTSRIHPDDVEPCRVLFRRAVADCGPYRVQYRLRRGDGSHAVIEDHGIPTRAADGRFEGFVVYGWDVTARQAAEAGLLAAKEEAERANRAKSEFLSRMSHELRTPLNAVLGFAQLMHADGSDPLSPAQQGRLQELERGARHLLVLINDVLDLARIEAGMLPLALSAVDVAGVVDECLPLVQRAAVERQLALSLRPPAAPVPLVSADPVRLKQVLLNLLSNAVKYTPSGGRVWLAWQAVAGGVRIEVGDTGPGLAAQQQERLFQPFERLDAARSNVDGAGIGLALSKWLVNLMQGEMGVNSEPGAGSVFWVQMSAAEPAAAAPQPPQPAALPPPGPAREPGRPRRVLYVEDNEVNRLLMQGMLARSPDVVLQLAELPEQGLAMAAAEPPQLVLLDIQLPGMDGFEVLRRLRAMPGLAGVPVVAVSANAMPADREKAAAAGFDDYITKPVDMPLLLATVERLLG